MPLDIKNFNPEYNEDVKNIDELIHLLEDLKEEIGSKNYKPYKGFVQKITKYISFIGPSFQKELNEYKSDSADEILEDDSDDDDVKTIASVSEYEQEDPQEIESEMISNFDSKYNDNINNVFEVELIKTY